MKITLEQMAAFKAHLLREERSGGTIEKYLRDVRAFAAFADGEEVNKERMVAWKEGLLSGGHSPVTVNSMLAAVNSFLTFTGCDGCRVKALRLQRRMFREQGRELTRGDYARLLNAARERGQSRLELLMETVCSTGIRVGEVRYMTVEAARCGRADISLKGKLRTILLPGKLCRKLLKYAKHKKIASGEIFLTRSGNRLGRKQIWAEMKAICKVAGVEAGKVFPHNLRHLFARTFYAVSRDIVKLADVLGHCAVETTRIYLLSTGAEHARQIEHLGLIS